MHDALDAGDALDVALEPTNCCTSFQIPDGRRAVATTCSHEASRAVKSCKRALRRKGGLDSSWVSNVERIYKKNGFRDAEWRTAMEDRLNNEVFIIHAESV